jgi:hypothetical protein
MKRKLLLIFETTSLILFIGLLLSLFWKGEEELIPLTAKALKASITQERWNGIFFADQHVGYSVARSAELEDGRRLMEQRSVFKVSTFGKSQQIITAGSALSSPAGTLEQFDFFMVSGDIKLSARGTIIGKQIVMEINQGGERNEVTFDVQSPPHVSLSLEAAFRQQEFAIGKSFSIPYFDPITLNQQEMVFRITDSEILENGEEAWWLQSSFGGMVSRTLIDSSGAMLRQEGGAMGLSVVRMSPEDAQNIPMGENDVDLIALSAVPLKGRLTDPRTRTELVVEISGVDASKIMHQPPLQIIEDKQVSIKIPDISSFEDEAFAAPLNSDFLEETLTIPVSHKEIRSKSAEIVEGSSTRIEAVRRLNTFVFDYMAKDPTIGVPNGLLALRSAKGDCNEHTALFVSLARAAQIPTRITAGLVYSERAGPRKSFYYHAWAEVLLQDTWVPVDPTFGQFPADATHIKVVEGDLDKQISIMGLLGNISLKLIDTK